MVGVIGHYYIMCVILYLGILNVQFMSRVSYRMRRSQEDNLFSLFANKLIRKVSLTSFLSFIIIVELCFNRIVKTL